MLAFYFQIPPGLNHPFLICQRCLNEVRQNVEFDRVVRDADSFWTFYLTNYPKFGPEPVMLIVDDESQASVLPPEMFLREENTARNSLVIGTDVANFANFVSDAEVNQLCRVDQKIETGILNVKEDSDEESVAPTEIFVHNNAAVVSIAPVIDSDVGNMEDFQPDNNDELENIPTQRMSVMKASSRYCDICHEGNIITSSA